MQDKKISRRTLAKGAAWAIPAVTVVGAVPAFAASGGPTVSGSICRLFYGDGTINYQTHSIYLGITTSTGIIPAGTTISWTIAVSGGGAGTGGTNEVPTTNYSANGSWTLSLDQTSGNAIVGGMFTVTIHFNTDYTTGAGPGGTWCNAALVWTDIYSLRPGASISVSSNAPTGSGIVSGGSGTLSYTVARRHPTSVNTTGRTPHIYISKSGTQACYPGIGYSRLLNTNGTDNVTTYPAGTTLPTSSNPCTWDGRFCWSATGGLSTPAYLGGAASGQYDTPQVC